MMSQCKQPGLTICKTLISKTASNYTSCCGHFVTDGIVKIYIVWTFHSFEKEHFSFDEQLKKWQCHSVRLSSLQYVRLFVRPSVCTSVCLSVHLFVHSIISDFKFLSFSMAFKSIKKDQKGIRYAYLILLAPLPPPCIPLKRVMSK